jgi:asparagine synthase (glutamine-hydrolysing)
LSAFAVIYDRSNTPVEASVLECAMKYLDHRGPDGKDVTLAGPVGMGHWHFWTTPEEVGEKQPLRLDDAPFLIVFDGRLDNREELIKRLSAAPASAGSLSDARLVLLAYAQWGEQCFQYFLGEFALVILDENQRRVICARDALGLRTLFHCWHGTRFVVASEAWAVGNACGVTPELNESAAAHYFVSKAPRDGQTLFKNVYELLPAQILVVEEAGQRSWRYWQVDPSRRLHYKDDKEYAGQYLALLEEAVRCRLRANTSVGVLMSGGLDSTSVACLAARQVSPKPLTTISYVFDEYPDGDERLYIDSVAEKYGLRSIQIPCDDLYPFQDWPAWPTNPNYPIENFYTSIRDSAHQRAHQEGIRVLLTGDYGDHLYCGSQDWLADLLSEGRLVEAGRESVYHLLRPELRRDLVRYLRRVARRMLDPLPFSRYLHAKPRPPAWLTPRAAALLAHEYSQRGPVSDRQISIAGLLTSQFSAMETFSSSRDEIELRYPYRDRRLVEFMLAIPTHQLYRRGTSRMVLRNAMQGILPEKTRTRLDKGSLITLYADGFEKKKEQFQAFFSETDAIWKDYVNPDWLFSRWGNIFSIDKDGPEEVVPWDCIAFSVWYKCHIGMNLKS